MKFKIVETELFDNIIYNFERDILEKKQLILRSDINFLCWGLQ